MSCKAHPPLPWSAYKTDAILVHILILDEVSESDIVETHEAGRSGVTGAGETCAGGRSGVTGPGETWAGGRSVNDR